MGNITRDIEMRYTPGGTAVCELGLAVNEKRKDAKGEWVEDVTFVDVTLWGRTAEIAQEYLGKGDPLLVEGRLKLDTWEKDGQKRSKLRVVCENMRMLGKKGGGGGGGGGNSRRDESEAPRGGGGGYRDREADPTEFGEEPPRHRDGGAPGRSSVPADDIPF
jgi:single-strand DNA-binding protein